MTCPGCPTTLCSELRKMADPIDLPFGLWTRVGRRKHMFHRFRQVALMCPHGRAHWRHLANTIEPVVYAAAMCNISVTPAIPERFRDEFLMIKRYTNLRLL